MRAKNKKVLNSEFLAQVASSAALFLFAALFIVGAASIILVAYYGVPMGDDYLAIHTFSNRHTWLEEAWYSLTHTGRYLQSITSSVAYGGLRGNIAVLLPLMVLAWAYVLIYLSTQLLVKQASLKISKVQSHFMSIVLIVLLVTAGQVQDKSGVWLMYQPFYFSSAIVTYTIAVLLYATLFYLYFRYVKVVKQYPRTSMVLFLFLTYVAGLYNESTPATLLGLSTIAIFVTYIYRRKKDSVKLIRKYLYALLGSSTLALVTMYLSPSSASRRDQTGALQDTGILTPIMERISTATTQLFYQPIDLLVIVVFAFLMYWFIFRNQLIAPRYSKVVVIGLALLVGSFLSLIAAITLLILGYGVSSAIYPRTMLLVQILYIVGTIILATGIIGLITKKLSNKILPFLHIFAAIISLTLLTIVAPHLMSRYTDSVNGANSYKVVWTEQDRILREAAKTNPTETIYLNDMGAGIGDGFSVQCTSQFSSNTNWLNNGLEEFYGVKKICAKSDLQAQP